MLPSSGMEQILTAVAASVLHSASGMSKWGMADLTVGLYKLSGRHALEGAVDTIPGVPIVHPSELEDMLEWLSWGKAAYKRDKQSLASVMKIREEDIVKLVSTSAVMKPAFYIVVHHQRCCVVMGIRGTNTANDVLTDLNPHSEPFEGGYAHSGMLASANWLLQNEGQTLHDVLHENPGFGLVLAGHSLGAGTAALLALMLRETLPSPDGHISRTLRIPAAMVICWGFGCPPCVDLNLAVTSSFIYNVVLQDDVVARVSPAALEDLRSEIAQTEWSQAFKDGTTQRRVVEMLQETAARFSQVELSPKTMAVFNQAKQSGYGPLLNAGNNLFSTFTGAKSSKGAKGKSSAWLALGAAAAGNLFTAASNRVSQGVNKSLSAIEKNHQKSDEGVAATALAVNATASTSANSEALIKCRLFVPGRLYHILRQPLQPGEIQPNLEGGEPRKFRHTVVRSTDANARFGRIVLSTSMLSDHSTPTYIEAVVDALQYARRSMGFTPHQ